MSEIVSGQSFSPLRLQERHVMLQIAAVALGTAFLAASSYISVPMYPVSMTMQTFAVMLIGALYGWRLGTLTVLAWLAEGIAGFPVFANGSATLLHVLGPTGGYLISFPIMAALTGWLVARGWNGQRPWLAFANALLSHGVCLVIGATWLATLIGVEKAIIAGIIPFIISGILKSALFAFVLMGLNRLRAKDTGA